MKKFVLLGMMAGAALGSNDEVWWETNHDKIVKDGIELYKEAQDCPNPDRITLRRIEDTVVKSAKQTRDPNTIEDAINMCPDSPLATRLSPLRRTTSPSTQKR